MLLFGYLQARSKEAFPNRMRGILLVNHQDPRADKSLEYLLVQMAYNG